MEFHSLPRRRAPLSPRLLLPALGVALLLAGTAPLKADPAADLSRSIDGAGNAVNQQLREWLDVGPQTPAKRQPPRRQSATPAKPTNAAVPRPPQRPEEAKQEATTAPPTDPKPSDSTSSASPASTSTPPASASGTSTTSTSTTAPSDAVAAAPLPEAKPANPPDVPTVETLKTSPVTLVPPPTPTPGPERAQADPPVPAEKPAVIAEPAPVPLPPAAPERMAAIPPPGPAATVEPAPEPAAQAEAMPTICPELSNEDIGIFTPSVVTATNTACTVDRGVNLSAVRMKDGRLVTLEPAAVLRCEMAASVAHWLRESVEPAVATLGAPLDKVMVAASQQCRPRNRVAGAKISEHGRGNALDISGYALKDGRRVVIGTPSAGEEKMPVAFRERLKASACADFTTILGPGSDGYHEDHLHVDRARRRSGAVLCQWATAEAPPKPKAAPLPPEKPAEAVSPDHGPDEGEPDAKP